MRWLGIAVLCVALAGCYATGANVETKLAQDYIGKNVDALVVRWGPPASSFKMNSGETAYSWHLATGSSISISRHGQSSASGSSRENACKVNVVASPSGTIKSLATEDSDTSLYYGPIPTGVELGSVCAEKLGMKQ